MVFYIGDRNSRDEGPCERRHRTGPVTVKHAEAEGARAITHATHATHAGLTWDQAGLRQTVLDCCLVFFTRANTDDAFDVRHEDLAVANLSGTRRADDGVNDLIRL
jgi:hypothetical protein